MSQNCKHCGSLCIYKAGLYSRQVMCSLLMRALTSSKQLNPGITGLSGPTVAAFMYEEEASCNAHVVLHDRLLHVLYVYLSIVGVLF